LPLDGLTRSAHRELPYCFHAESPIEQRRSSPMASSDTGAGAAPLYGACGRDRAYAPT
jgi:hypothetical protein